LAGVQHKMVQRREREERELMQGVVSSRMMQQMLSNRHFGLALGGNPIIVAGGRFKGGKLDWGV
jgi:hypothetical protein